MFYLHKETKEFKSKSLLIDEYTKQKGFDNRFDFLREGWEEHTKFYPELYNFKTIKINVVLQPHRINIGESEYFDVPTEFILNNIENKEVWQECPKLFNKDIFDIIKENERNKIFNYNSTIGKMFLEKFNVEKNVDDCHCLNSIVYTTQGYNRNAIDYERYIENQTKLFSEGYVKADEKLFNELLESDKNCLVVLNGENVFGQEGSTTKKLKLKDWGSQGLHWMEARAKRKGYAAYKGQFVKVV